MYCIRFDEHTKGVLDWYMTLFGDGFLKNLMIDFTWWGHTRKEAADRDRNNRINEQSQGEKLEGLIRAHLNDKEVHHIPSVFIGENWSNVVLDGKFSFLFFFSDAVCPVFKDPKHNQTRDIEPRELDKFRYYAVEE